MLQVPRLDGDDYEKIFERAKARIPTLTQEWTNFNAADPGITTLQTFAWLYDTLHYYMNASGEAHKLKYFKLLGIEPVERPAACVLALEGEGPLDVPRGARVWADDVPFETQEAFAGEANRLCAVYLDEGGRLADLSPRAGVDGGFAPLFAPGTAPGAALYLGFAKPFAARAKLYLEIEAQPRTPFGEDFSLAAFAWEAFDGEEWRAVRAERDETCGFLKSGFVTLCFDAPCAPAAPQEGMAKACYVRCRLAENHFDLTPRLGRVLPCCVRARQMQTWAQVETFFYDGSGALRPDFCAGPDTLAAVFVRCAGKETYAQWRGFAPSDGDRAQVELPAGTGRLCVRFDAGRFGEAPKKGDEVLVAAMSPQAADVAWLGRTDGCSGQRLDIDAENLCGLTLALLHTGADGRTECSLWRRCADLGEVGWDDCMFELDERERQVVFGDNRHGCCPPAGWDVVAVEIRTSRFEGGNVLAHSVCAPDAPLPGVQRVYNPLPAEGGCRRKSAAQLQTELDAMMAEPARAVTEEDYRAIALATPGLMLDSVAVIPMREYSARYGVPYAGNTVVVAVKPRAGGRLPRLSETYRKAVAAHLEQARILTTDVRAVGAQYVGVGVYGRVRLRPGEEGGRARVEQLLREAVETVDTGEYGRGVDCGRLFSALELEPCVQSVENLSLEYIGRGGGKNEHGDVTAGPDCLTYLTQIGIEYI